MNRVFLDIEGEHNAYWLGFMFADGNVYHRKDGRVAINLTQKDPIHLQKFCDFIGAGVPGKRTRAGYEWYVVQVYSHEMAADLAAHGCVPNKSKILAPPLGIPREFERHFIRGYNDGDGGIYPKYKKLRMRGTEGFLGWVQEKLPSYSSVLPGGPTFQLTSCSANAISNVGFLYTNASVALERKYRSAMELLA